MGDIITVRCQGPTGRFTLEVNKAMSIDNFLALLGDNTGIDKDSIDILNGYPQKLIQLEDTSAELGSLNIQHGDALTVRKGANRKPAQSPAIADQSLISEPREGNLVDQFGDSGLQMPDDENADLQAVLAMSLEEARNQQHNTTGNDMQGSYNAPNRGSDYSSSKLVKQNGKVVGVRMSDGSVLVRRVVPDDNSCLFNAVGYVVERSRTMSAQLRQKVAEAVKSDDFTYNEGFLGKPNQDYVQWILKPNSWGGGIELSILSAQYHVKIAAYDISTQRRDVYGSESDSKELVILVYNGLHYDALVQSLDLQCPEDADITIFSDGPVQEDALKAADELVQSLNKSGEYTDTATFQLRCGTCGQGLVGENDAMKHAQSTGHSNFTEYK